MSRPVQQTGSDSVDQLDRIVEVLHQVNRTLPKTVLGREELRALGGLLTQINSVLLTLRRGPIETLWSSGTACRLRSVSHVLAPDSTQHSGAILGGHGRLGCVSFRPVA